MHDKYQLQTTADQGRTEDFVPLEITPAQATTDTGEYSQYFLLISWL